MRRLMIIALAVLSFAALASPAMADWGNRGWGHERGHGHGHWPHHPQRVVVIHQPACPPPPPVVVYRPAYGYYGPPVRVIEQPRVVPVPAPYYVEAPRYSRPHSSLNISIGASISD